MVRNFAGIGMLALTLSFASAPMATAANPVVVVDTSMGSFEIELYQDKAPITVKNFLDYVEAKHYDGTIFHRVMGKEHSKSDFMIQGGGFLPGMKEKPNNGPIKNEAANGLKNERGTVAMARTNVVDSATAQFFVNVADNDFLNHTSPTPQGFGYAVFGKVVSGMDVVDKIKAVPVGNKGGHGNVPTTDVIIKSIRVKKSA